MGRATMQVVLVVAAVFAVSDGAVGQAVPTQTGRELDASPQVGSGGYNSPTGSVGGVNSQLYVTGQVTGLGQFRGRVPYISPGLLQTNVPSARFSTFDSQSVGLQDVLRGQTYLTGAYYEPSRTVFNAAGTVSGQTGPGSDVPRSSSAQSSLARKLYVDMTADYGPIMTMQQPIQSGQALSVLPPLRPVDDRGVAAAGTADRLVADQFAVSRPGAGALFGVLKIQDRTALAQELYEMQYRENQVDARVITEVAPPMLGRSQADLTGRTGGGIEDSAGRPGAGRRQPPEIIVPGPDVGNDPVPRPNKDIYMDLLIRLHEQRGGTDLVRPVVGAARPESPGVIAKPVSPLGQQVPSPGEIKIVEIAKDKTVVLHGLAGVSTDQFNFHMGRAEKKLKAGRFYDAAGDYEIALTINASNPLAHVGLGLSLLAAGEPLSAAMYVRRAMEIFPPLMETRLDIPAMLDKDLVLRRLTGIQRRLDDAAEKPDPSLVFLAAYVCQNLGQTDQAKRYAEQLQTLAEGDKLLSAYATYVLTGARPQATPMSATTRAATATPATTSPGR